MIYCENFSDMSIIQRIFSFVLPVTAAAVVANRFRNDAKSGRFHLTFHAILHLAPWIFRLILCPNIKNSCSHIQFFQGFLCIRLHHVCVYLCGSNAGVAQLLLH